MASLDKIFFLLGLLCVLILPERTSSVALNSSVVDYGCEGCLQGQTIVAMYLANDYTINEAAKLKMESMGLTYDCNDPVKAVPECFAYSNWNKGVVGDLSNRIFSKLGAKVIVKTKANFTSQSKALYDGPSSFTRCVYEVAVKNVDVCIGNFWETNERRRLATFTSSFDLDAMFLVSAPKNGVGSGSTSDFNPSDLLAIFKPFTPAVWGITVAFFFATAVFMWILEAGIDTVNENFSHEDDQRWSISGFLMSLWLSFMGYVGGSHAHTATRWPSRMILLGYGFLLYITVSSYTANLASFMVNKASVPSLINSIADTGKKGVNVCVLDAMATLLYNFVPQEQVVGFDVIGPAIEGIYSGRCGAVVIGRDYYKQYILAEKISFNVCKDPSDTKGYEKCQNPAISSTKIELDCKCKDLTKDPTECTQDCPDYRKYCELLTIADSTFQVSVPTGFPVAREFVDHISAAIVNFRLDGTIDRLFKQYIDEKFVPVCTSNAESDSLALDLFSLAGTYVISGGLMVIGLVLGVIETFVKKKQASDSSDSNSQKEEEVPTGVARRGFEPEKEKRQELKELGMMDVDNDENGSVKKDIQLLSQKMSEILQELKDLKFQTENIQAKGSNHVADGGLVIASRMNDHRTG
eukprot:765087-Hanusia_phi.AAC.1